MKCIWAYLVFSVAVLLGVFGPQPRSFLRSAWLPVLLHEPDTRHERRRA